MYRSFFNIQSKKVLVIDSPDFKTYCEHLLNTLSHFGVAEPDTTLTDSDCVKEAIVSDESIAKWKRHGRYLSQNQKK